MDAFWAQNQKGVVLNASVYDLAESALRCVQGRILVVVKLDAVPLWDSVAHQLKKKTLAIAKEPYYDRDIYYKNPLDVQVLIVAANDAALSTIFKVGSFDAVIVSHVCTHIQKRVVAQRIYYVDTARGMHADRAVEWLGPDTNIYDNPAPDGVIMNPHFVRLTLAEIDLYNAETRRRRLTREKFSTPRSAEQIFRAAAEACCDCSEKTYHAIVAPLIDNAKDAVAKPYTCAKIEEMGRILQDETCPKVVVACQTGLHKIMLKLYALGLDVYLATKSSAEPIIEFNEAASGALVWPFQYPLTTELFGVTHTILMCPNAHAAASNRFCAATKQVPIAIVARDTFEALPFKMLYTKQDMQERHAQTPRASLVYPTSQSHI